MRAWSGYEISRADFEEHPRWFPGINEVTHVAHQSDACSIIKDESVRSGLVWDDSKLRAERLNVAWVSPNYWHPGFMYGTVSFHFPWSLFATKKHELYWIEAMTSYKPHALRFLICEPDEIDEEHRNNLVKRKLLSPVDPTRFGAPLYLDKDGNWFRINGFTYEFMVPRQLSLSGCNAISFENHHRKYCNKFSSTAQCNESDKHLSILQIVSLAISAGRSNQLHRLLNIDDGKADLFRDFLDYFFEKWLLPKITVPAEREPLAKHRDVLDLAFLALGEGYVTTPLRALQKISPYTIAEYLQVRISKRFGDVLDGFEIEEHMASLIENYYRRLKVKRRG